MMDHKYSSGTVVNMLPSGTVSYLLLFNTTGNKQMPETIYDKVSDMVSD